VHHHRSGGLVTWKLAVLVSCLWSIASRNITTQSPLPMGTEAVEHLVSFMVHHLVVVTDRAAIIGVPDKQPSSYCRLSHGVKISNECVSVWLLTFLAETLGGQLQPGIFSVGMIAWLIEESGILSPDGCVAQW